MRKLILIIFTVFSGLSFSQNYDLFPNQEDRLFYIPITAETSYELSFDSVILNDQGTTYYNYFNVGAELESENCNFWGGPICFEQNLATWMGNRVFKDINGTYFFFNNMGDTLTFNFQPVLNEPQLFYEDENQSFYIEYQGTSFTQVLGVFDSIRSFKIHHYDTNGNIIESPLNDHPINISKTIGLVDFFAINEFPVELQPLQIGGTPILGINHLTEAVIQDHEIGDEIQYKEIKSTYNGPPWNNYIKYTLYQYLDKWEENNSINYQARRSVFYEDSTTQIIDTVNLSYSYLDTIAKLPFLKPNPEEILVDKSIYFHDYEGLPLLTYHEKLQNLIYCAEDNCWGNFDIFSSMYYEESIFVSGLGVFYYQSQDHPLPDQTYFSNEIVYFKKFDYLYGNQVVLNTTDLQLWRQLRVFPQPASNEIVFQSPHQEMISTIQIFDLTGKNIRILNVNDSEFYWECNEVKTGIYFYKALINGVTFRGKLMIQ